MCSISQNIPQGELAADPTSGTAGTNKTLRAVLLPQEKAFMGNELNAKQDS